MTPWEVEVEIVMGCLLPNATTVSPVGKVVSLPEPEMLTILFPVAFFPLARKVFVFGPDAKNVAAPDGGLVNTFWLVLMPVGPPLISRMEEPCFGPSGRCVTVVTRVTGSCVMEALLPWEEVTSAPCVKKMAPLCPELLRMP